MWCADEPVMRAEDELRQIAQAQLDTGAFAPLYERYVHLVWNYCLVRLRDPDRAADATSATFEKALRALHRYRPDVRGDGTTFRSWLMTIARNVVLDDLRRRPTVPLGDAFHLLAQREDGPEALALAGERRRELLAAYAQLSDQQQDVIRLRQQGLSGEEIGAVLGIGVGAVKSTHYRAIQRLRQILQEGDAP